MNYRMAIQHIKSLVIGCKMVFDGQRTTEQLFISQFVRTISSGCHYNINEGIHNSNINRIDNIPEEDIPY